MLSVHPTSDGDDKDHTPVALNHTELLLPWMIGRTNKFCSSSLLGCWKVRVKEGLWAGPALVKTHTEPPSLRESVSGSLQTKAESIVSYWGLH